MEATVNKQSAPKESACDSEDWLKQDYGDIIGEVSDQSESSSSSDDEVEKNPITVSSGKPECTIQDAQLPSIRRKVEMMDACTQTEESQRIVTIKRTKRFRQNEVNIEKI